MRHVRCWSAAALGLGLLVGPACAGFTTFESGQVRPVALSQSPSGTRLLAVSTPAAKLEIFNVTPGGLAHVVSVPVGLEPVAVATRTLPNEHVEAWVVNHLSDSVSIVDLDPTTPTTAHVVRTLLVGDEPRDIVFAGAGGNRAFITTAHRGQNAVEQGFDPQLTTPGVGRADVWVFDADDLGTSLWGTPLARVVLFADTPRALAVSPDGATVYAAAFHSGNQTTSLSEGAVCNGGALASPCMLGDASVMPGGLPLPNDNFEGVHGPETGLIVKFDPGSGEWRDGIGRDWSPAVRFDLPDLDVFAIDADATPPVETASWASVGTVLFNLAVNPQSGRVYVSNTDARNEVRFEGPGIYGGSTVLGHLAESRITVLDGATVLPRHLNKHIPYGTVPSPAGVSEKSLATPLGMAVTSDGATLYVAAFGSSKVGRFATAALEDDSFVPSAATHVTLSGGGPSGLALDEANERLYVLTRFNNAIAVVDTALQEEIASVPLFNPEPPSVVNGRPFLYDAAFTSSNGEAACASCHIFGDFDSLAWDLGNPDDVVVENNPNPLRVPDPFFNTPNRFHPLKGPMTTQSLRGMANHGPMHWRGDRTGGTTGGDPLDERLAFKAFNVAFAGLLGRAGPLSPADMEAFTDFILQVRYPPNPIRGLSSGLNATEAAGRDFFLNRSPSDQIGSCRTCHVLNPDAGFFGSDGLSSFETEPQFFKIAHLRNLYQKVGMFGMPLVPFIDQFNGSPPLPHMGPQVRGFGFLHDGSFDTIFHFLNTFAFAQTPQFNPRGFVRGAPGDPDRREVEAFLLAFDTDFRPGVGQQVTLSATSPPSVVTRITDLRLFCGFVVVKGVVGGERRGWVYLGDDRYRPDRFLDPAVSTSQLQQIAAVPGQELTFTCVPPADHLRLGVDADDDGLFDRDEIDDGSDPEDPASGPAPPLLVGGQKLVIKNVIPENPAKNQIDFASKDPTITAPAPGTPSDPRCIGVALRTTSLTIRSATSGQSYTVPLPCYDWQPIGPVAAPLGYKFKNSVNVIESTVKTAVWRNGQLKVKVKSPFASLKVGYDLKIGVPQGAVDVAFTSGPSRICMRCTPSAGRDGSDGRKYLARTVDCAAPAACPTE
jgi:DNA-binding beta-propeller fold protein YncE